MVPSFENCLGLSGISNVMSGKNQELDNESINDNNNINNVSHDNENDSCRDGSNSNKVQEKKGGINKRKDKATYK